MRKGFSLIELLIVIVILGLLASLVLPNLMGKGEEAKQKIACIQMKSIKDSLNMFKMDNGMYPSTEEGLKALIKNPNPEKYPNYSSMGYLNNKLPKDPWNHRYIYVNNHGNIDIISLGADGREGGEGDNKDIRLSECKR